MFWKRKRRSRVELTHVPIPVLIRQAIYDSMLMPSEAIAEAMGLPPISDEVAEMEEAASQQRLERFSKLLPFIDSHADIAARIAASAYMIEDDETEGDDPLGLEDLEGIVSLFRLVSLASTVSCVSALVNLGLVEMKVGHGK